MDAAEEIVKSFMAEYEEQFLGKSVKEIRTSAINDFVEKYGQLVNMVISPLRVKPVDISSGKFRRTKNGVLAIIEPVYERYKIIYELQMSRTIL